jgi:branched-chain amino acid transport system substrate-binding protein
MVVTQRSQIPQIAPSSSSPKITSLGNKYVFQTIPHDIIQANALATFAIKDQKYQKIAILHANDDYGLGGMEAFKDKAKSFKINPLILSYNPGDKEYTSQIVRFKQYNPQLIVVWGMQTEAALFMKQARQQGITAQFMARAVFPARFLSISPAQPGME